jgi:multicomponent Na+:H+ antiporter subunit G
MGLSEIIGAILLIIGALFSILGVVGILRLPDTYTRLHASGKTSTLGVLFLCAGTAVILPDATLRLIALGIFLIFSGPVGSHAIAAAVHRGANAENSENQ